MDSARKRTPDYTDIAYREAVARLRYLLAESYSPHSSPTKTPHVHSTKADDSGDETDASMAISDRSRSIHHHHHPPPSFRSPYYGAKRSLYTDFMPKSIQPTTTLQVPKIAQENTGNVAVSPKSENQPPPPELMAFIERQEDYIEQLEKESQFCREELSSLLSKVKDVISENEGLHEKEKSGLLKSVFEYLTSGGEEEEEDDDDQEEKRDRKKSPSKKKRLEGPSIVFESRISELEAQLTQTKIELRKAQEEAETLRKKCEGIEPGSSETTVGLNIESYRKQIETLQREKEELAENLGKFSSAVSHMRDKESDASQKIKRSLDLVDQAQFEKTQAELEVRRLKDELERQHEKLRDLLQEQGRRVQDERSQAERRYAQQVEQLTCDLSTQWDTAGKLQLELEKQRRTENELRRELQQKISIIDELKKELQTKIAGLQSEATQSAAERGSVEQELAASRLAAERAERESRQEAARLQAEITALRQRLDRADADVLHSRRENLRLSEQIASLERELNLAKMMKGGDDKVAGESRSPSKSREKELSSMIMNMETKHVQTVGELESMIQSQTELMEKLKDECRSLTQKLEESSARHKEERTALRVEKAVLLSKLEQVWENFKELEQRSLENSVCSSNPAASGISMQTTPMLRAMSEAPSMALRLSSSTNNSPNTRHSLQLNLSPSSSLSPSTKCSSPAHIPSKNTHPSPHTSPSLNLSSVTKSTHHSPHISRNNTSKNTLHSPLTSLNQNMSKSMPNSPLTSPRQNTSLQHNTNHNQILMFNQVMELTPATTSVMNSPIMNNSPTMNNNPITNNSPIMNNNQTMNNNQVNTCQSTKDNKHNTKCHSPSTSLHNTTNREVKGHKISTQILQDPSKLSENSPAQTRCLLLHEDRDLCPGKDLVLTNCPPYLQPAHHTSSDKVVLNFPHVHPAEQQLCPESSLAQICNLPLTHPQPTTQHSQVLKVNNNLTQTSTKDMTMGSRLNMPQPPTLNPTPSLVDNQVQSHEPVLALQAWNASGEGRTQTCPLPCHPLPSLKLKRNLDRPPPLTLEDLATDSDTSES